MGIPTQDLISGSGVIVSHKRPPKSQLFRWDEDLIKEVHEIAHRTHRSINETGELLMRWAVDRAKSELEAVSDEPAVKRKHHI